MPLIKFYSLVFTQTSLDATNAGKPFYACLSYLLEVPQLLGINGMIPCDDPNFNCGKSRGSNFEGLSRDIGHSEIGLTQ